MSLPLKLDKYQLKEHAAEVMVYFERHKLMDIVSRIMAEISLVRPEDPQLWMAKNIMRIADKIYTNCLEISHKHGQGKIHFYQLPGRYLYRVAIFGRKGSGRKTQAMVLVKRFGLVYIDAELIIYQGLRDSDELSKQLQHTFIVEDVKVRSKVLGKLISKRFLQDDALHRGWVLVNYPNNLEDFQELFEHFKVPPNKLVYLQCPELMAKRRLIEKPPLGRPQDNCDYIEHNMRYFKQIEPEVDEYLARRHETIYVDSTKGFEVVKTNMLARLERQPYVMGFKY